MGNGELGMAKGFMFLPFLYFYKDEMLPFQPLKIYQLPPKVGLSIPEAGEVIIELS